VRRGAGSRARQRGAALLLAMLLLVLIVTLAGGMVWQQARALEVESAERARAQAAWVLNGALDWTRLILAEDGRSGRGSGREHDSLDEPWATPLAEARLSTFLAVDQENNTDAGPEAFLSGRIVDAQARYNLRSLLDATGKPAPAQLEGVGRLARAAGLPDTIPARLAAAASAAWGLSENPQAARPLPPQRLEDLAWYGFDAATIEALRPWFDVLPGRTPVNLNTAPAAVMLAAIDNLDLGSAERLVQARQREPFTSLDQVRELLGPGLPVEPERASVLSRFFEVTGRLRIEDRALQERSLVERRGSDRGGGVVVVRRIRESVAAGAAAP
jgi:general secretion pathway protein K